VISALSFSDLILPDGWPLLCAVDTGAYMSALLVTVAPDPPTAFALYECPNYRYVGGEIELLGLSNADWAQTVVSAYNHLRKKTGRVHCWVDMNSQFKAELSRYGLVLRGNPKKLELRVEITRQYVNVSSPSAFYLAPWLSILPYEMEHARWPDDTTSAGKYERIKRHDHTLDCLEHILSRHPRGKMIHSRRHESFLDQYLREHKRDSPFQPADPHLGRHL
jgi:hypothetical protein